MKLGIKTVGGKWPSPHILRHTLATLNIEPFGKCLSARVMQQRLIHVDLSTLENNYVHNNPLGEMEHYRILLARGERNDCFHRVSKDDFFMILDSLPSLSHSVVKEIKTVFIKELSKHEQVFEGVSDFISESAAIEILGEFKVDYRSLRVWALKERIASMKTVDGKITYVYDKSKLEHLKKDYLSVEMATRKFKGSRTNFYLRLKSCQKIHIGRTSLILKDDFLSHILDGCQPVHIGSTKELNGRMVA